MSTITGGLLSIVLVLYAVYSHHLTSKIAESCLRHHGQRLSRGHRLSLYLLSPLSHCLIILGDALLGDET